MLQGKIPKKINEFFNILSKNNDLPGRERDHGLIIIEDIGKDSEVFIEGLVNKIDNAFFCEDASKYHLFVNYLKKAVQKKVNLIVGIKEGVHPKVISILKESSLSNSVYLENFKNQEIFCLKLNPETRIIFVSKRSILENKVQYKYLYNLFGPILSI